MSPSNQPSNETPKYKSPFLVPQGKPPAHHQGTNLPYIHVASSYRLAQPPRPKSQRRDSHDPQWKNIFNWGNLLASIDTYTYLEQKKNIGKWGSMMPLALKYSCGHLSALAYEEWTMMPNLVRIRRPQLETLVQPKEKRTRLPLCGGRWGCWSHRLLGPETQNPLW
jgi:hypothetical protein